MCVQCVHAYVCVIPFVVAGGHGQDYIPSCQFLCTPHLLEAQGFLFSLELPCHRFPWDNCAVWNTLSVSWRQWRTIIPKKYYLRPLSDNKSRIFHEKRLSAQCFEFKLYSQLSYQPMLWPGIPENPSKIKPGCLLLKSKKCMKPKLPRSFFCFCFCCTIQKWVGDKNNRLMYSSFIWKQTRICINVSCKRFKSWLSKSFFFLFVYCFLFF